MEKAKELITQAQNNNILSFDIKVFYTKIIEEAKSYQGLIFTEETIGDAKKILAEARKHREEYNKQRIDLCRPYTDAISNVKKIVDEALEISFGVAIKEIQDQIDEVENNRIKERENYINETYKRIFGNSQIPLRKIYDKKWLNKTTSVKKILSEIQQKYLKISNDEQTLRTLADGPFLTDVLDTFYDTLSLNDAISKLQKLKEIEKKVIDVHEINEQTTKVETSNQDFSSAKPRKTMVMSFRIRGTMEELEAVKEYIQQQNIEVLS